ncbi:MAG: isoprenylcysteine carboxylmethyltransferase family protein [Proteobacteria bacterium]|nr:isoprenylcysteine carboxylmethyltransferase family protein [Pseudomonadota bacterium]MBU1715452.1 isoprenylcysteine carboxylmethyltransferase family protein [Pseudomonadota bacterium]
MNKYQPKILKARLPVSIGFTALLVFMVLFSTSIWETTHPVVEISLFVSACFLVGIASLGRLWCSLYIAGYKLDTLVIHGPYSMCRNPLYFFSFLGGIGCGLATETLFIPLIIISFFTLYYPLVIKSEEIELRKIHKQALDDYLNKTPAFFPKISLLLEPSQYLVNPKVFRKHIFDALWFIWLVGILEVIEGIHELHFMPIFFKLF